MVAKLDKNVRKTSTLGRKWFRWLGNLPMGAQAGAYLISGTGQDGTGRDGTGWDNSGKSAYLISGMTG